jgi:MSHA biogenesis protein MshM
MYLEYFALKRHPFRITPDPTLFCPGGGRGEILDALIYAITSGEGIVKVVGEVGSGKTMLCRILEERLPGSVEIVYLANPKLSPHDILYAIAFELKLPVKPETERLMVMQQLQLYLLGQHAANRSVVVFVEEAQGMAIETLEEIRLLSNLETHLHKLLQIVLFGQPELDVNLRKRDIRQLKERITHSFHLMSLTKSEISEYLRFRLQAAGCGKVGVFSPGAEGLIAKASCGLIRRVNILADKAMLAAYADPGGSSGSKAPRAMVHSQHVRAAIRDSEFRLPFYHSPWFIGVSAAALLVLAGVLGWNQWGSRVATSPVVRENSLASPLIVKNAEDKKKEAPVVETGAQEETQPVKAAREILPESSGVTGEKKRELERPTSVAEIAADKAPLSVAELPAASASSPAPSQPAPTAIPASALEEQAVPEREQQIDKSHENLMAQRRNAGNQWLRKVGANNYTIQLMSADMSGEAEVAKFLRQIRPVSLLEKIYVCPVTRGERQVWVVVYGDFAEVTPARQVIDTLPPEVRRFQPFVRGIDEALLGRNAGVQQGAQEFEEQLQKQL